MRQRAFRLMLLFLAAINGHAVENELAEGSRVECRHSSVRWDKEQTEADAPYHRKYAPDRDVRIQHLELDITPDFRQQTFMGKAVIRFQPNLRPVTELKLDAVDLKIESVTSTEAIQTWRMSDKHLTITFKESVPADRVATVAIVYSAEPTKGLYFRTPEMGYREGDTHLFTQGESEDSRYWFPFIDSPNEKLTSEVTCRVPEGMTVISNGRLVSHEKDAASGLTEFHWSQDKPHANYLISLNAGFFKKLEGRHHDLPLAFWTPASEIGSAATSFQDTADMMEFFEQETGFPYPWAKYDQICVNDFMEGGMENTSATTLTDGTLYLPDTENIHESTSLVSHELAHQWFGDLVTCKDWSDTWLNEGFATYYQLLYEGHKNGRDSMLYGLYHNAREILDQSNDTNAIVRRNYGQSGNMFNYLAYPKGGWVLHMLRSRLGEELYKKCIQTYLTRHAYQNVETEDLRAVIAELSGRSYDAFFDQWLYHAHHPDLEVSWNWDETSKLARITVRQVQNLSAEVLLFDFPLTVQFRGKFGTVDRVIPVHGKETDVQFPLDSAPELVRLDPSYTLLARIDFKPGREMERLQLKDSTDVIGRLLAAEKLGSEQDHESVGLLKEALQHDSFYGVRLEAARALGSMHTDEALEALLASLDQPDARVRQCVVQTLGGFYRDSAYEATIQVIAREHNPEIIASAVETLGPYPRAGIRKILLKFLNTPSFRERLASAAITAMRAQEDPSYVDPLLDRLKKSGERLPTSVYRQGLGAVAYLARNEERKDPVLEFLLSQINDRYDEIKLASISALGTLGDDRALAPLKTFTHATKESPERNRAEKAIAAIQSKRKPADESKNIRDEVTSLQKESRELRKQLDDLKERIRAQEEASEKKSQRSKPEPEG